jgi:hypothetical protein
MADDPLELMDALTGDLPSRRRKRVGEYDDPIGDTVDRRKAAEATGRSDSAIAGQYIRYGFTWTPGQLEMIARVAEQLNLSKNAAARWLMDEGLKAYVDGVRPEIVEKTVRADVRLKEW